MNEIQTPNEGQEITVSLLIEYLKQFSDFKSFFIAVCDLKVEFSRDNLTLLQKSLNAFYDVYGSSAIVDLKDCISCERVLPCKRHTKRKYTEKEYQNLICEQFDSIFPLYKLIGTEIPVKGIGRIDILAEEKQNGRSVIIELKIKNKNPTQQLFSYAVEYENPVLIAITEIPVSSDQRRDGVIYLTYEEIGIN